MHHGCAYAAGINTSTPPFRDSRGQGQSAQLSERCRKEAPDGADQFQLWERSLRVPARFSPSTQSEHGEGPMQERTIFKTSSQRRGLVDYSILGASKSKA